MLLFFLWSSVLGTAIWYFKSRCGKVACEIWEGESGLCGVKRCAHSGESTLRLKARPPCSTRPSRDPTLNHNEHPWKVLLYFITSHSRFCPSIRRFVSMHGFSESVLLLDHLSHFYLERHVSTAPVSHLLLHAICMQNPFTLESPRDTCTPSLKAKTYWTCLDSYIHDVFTDSAANLMLVFHYFCNKLAAMSMLMSQEVSATAVIMS